MGHGSERGCIGLDWLLRAQTMTSFRVVRYGAGRSTGCHERSITVWGEGGCYMVYGLDGCRADGDKGSRGLQFDIHAFVFQDQLAQPRTSTHSWRRRCFPRISAI